MTASLSAFLGTPYLRRSLKRGLARQAVATARKMQADHSRVFSELSRLAPNRRALERGVLRLRKVQGVVAAGISGGTMVVVLRNACVLLTQVDGTEAFQEEGLIYTRVTAGVGKGGLAIWINRVNFSLHALERLVERSGCALGLEYLSAVDAEAKALLRSAMDNDLIEYEDDSYLRAKAEGVWAGSLDLTVPEPEWGVARTDARVPTFSARTFLSPDEMKPAVWLRWQRDPRLELVAA